VRLVNRKGSSKNQHWVPQFCLKYFATPATRGSERPQVWIFSKDDGDGDEVLTNVRNVCAKRYLYSPVDSDGSRNWELDERINGLESTLATAWPALTTEYVPLDDEWLRKGVALFVAVMHLRNPEARVATENIHRELVKFYESAPRLLDGIPDVDSIELNGKVHRVRLDGWHEYRAWGKHDHDKFFAHMVSHEAMHIAEMLLPKRWSVVFSETDTFITTDKPVVIQHQARPKAGFGTPGVIIMFPLSPRRLLVMDDMHAEPANQYYPLNVENIGAFNLSLWRNGSRFMITGRPVPDVLNELVAFGESQESSPDEPDSHNN
jgi:hypothetical protein